MSEHNIFLSYSSRNSEFAIQLAGDLRAHGLDVWRDHDNIEKGAQWDREIPPAIRASSHFLLVLSPDAIDSDNVLNEIDLARDANRFIIPILYEECEPPMSVRRIQWVDFLGQDYEDGLKELLHHFDVKYIPPHVYKPYLDVLFEDAEDRMTQLASENGGEFTSQQFLKSAAREKSFAYLDLLTSTRRHLITKWDEAEAEKWVFNMAHQSIGGRLSSVAQAAGYEQVKGGRAETDIFGNSTGRVAYRKQEA